MFLPNVRKNEEVRAFYSTGPHLESCNCWCIFFSFINRKAGKAAIEPETKVATEPQIVARDSQALG